jgi:hypothetical protein
MILLALGLAFLVLALTQRRGGKSRKQCLVIGWGSSFAGLLQMIVPLIIRS